MNQEEADQDVVDEVSEEVDYNSTNSTVGNDRTLQWKKSSHSKTIFFCKLAVFARQCFVETAHI